MRTKKLKYTDKFEQHPNMKVHPSGTWPFSFGINFDELYWHFYTCIRDKNLLQRRGEIEDRFLYLSRELCLPKGSK